MDTFPRISIVINTLDRAESLERTLTSLRQLRYPVFEVIVVNGPSCDHTAAVIEHHSTEVRAASCDQANLAVSRNIGIAMARGEIVAFIDDDAIPEPDWLDRLVTGYGAPEIVAVGGFIRDHGGIDFQCRVVIADRFGDSTDHQAVEGSLSHERYISLTGTNASFRLSALLAIGGFDEEYAYFLDETDVNLRLVERGWQAAVVGDAEIHHKFAASNLRSESRVPKSMYVQARSKGYFCAINAGAIYDKRIIVSHLTDYVRAEYRRKKQLFFSRRTSWGTSERLSDEVLRGVCDGVRDAYGQSARKLLGDALIAKHSEEVFKAFQVPLAAEQRLRICLVSQDYPPEGSGGIAQWTREMATGLADLGHEVTVITRSESAHPYIDFREGVWVHHIVAAAAPPSETAKYPEVPKKLLSYAWSVAEEIKRVQPRRQFGVISGPLWDLELLTILSDLNIPTVLTLQTSYALALPYKPDWQTNTSYRARHVEPVIARERKLLCSASYLLANSRALLADLEEAYDISLDGQRTTVIPHGLSDLAAEVGDEISLGDPNSDTCRLLFVGRLEPRKGIDLLLDILPELLQRFPRLIIDIVGDDTIKIGSETFRSRFERQSLKSAGLAARVNFHGKVGRRTLLRHYKACDLFVAPSRYESFGLIFVEAMMFGKPSVAISAGGVPEVITHNEDGLLICSDDPSALLDALSSLIADKTQRTCLGTRARQNYEQKFTRARMIGALESYFAKIQQEESGR